MKRIMSLICVVTVMVAMLGAFPMGASAAGKGDVDNNGKVNTSDVRQLLSLTLAGSISRTELYWGDYNQNSGIDTADARELLTRLINGEVSTDAINYAKPTGADYWGEKAVNVLGDSISFGVGTTDPIPEHSYVSYVKKAVQKANGGNMNYGFTSAYPTAWTSPKSEEIHAWPTRSETNGSSDWICDNNDDSTRLVTVGMTATKKWATITYNLRDAYKNSYDYFRVYYHTEPGAGQFVLSNIVNGVGYDQSAIDGVTTYDCNNSAANETKRTGFYRMSDFPNGISIVVTSTNNTPVTITGIGYYKNTSPDTVTFNSFTRGGISFVDQTDIVIDQVTAADTLIVAMGFNDYTYNYDRVIDGKFAERVSYLIKKANENGTQIIVTDHAWDNPSYNNIAQQVQARNIVKSELKRLAAETGGIYIDQLAVSGDALLTELNKGDKVHPNDAGMKIIAENIVEAMGLEWTESWT